MPASLQLRSAIVAENNMLWHSQLRQTVIQCGLQPLMNRNGYEAIELAHSTIPQLVIFGVSMPDMSGLSACEYLRRLPAYVAVPIIILGREHSEAMRAAAEQAGANRFLPLPLSIGDLLQAILPLIGQTPEQPMSSMEWPRRPEPSPLFGVARRLTEGREVLLAYRQGATPRISGPTNWSR